MLPVQLLIDCHDFCRLSLDFGNVLENCIISLSAHFTVKVASPSSQSPRPKCKLLQNKSHCKGIHKAMAISTKVGHPQGYPAGI